MKQYLSKHAGPKLQLVLVCTFIITIIFRGQFIGELSNRQHVWLTASTVKFTDIWINEGPINSDFLLIEEPASIDHPEIKDRTIYSSQPSGSIIPIYVLKKFFPKVDTLLIVHSYSLINHFLIALSSYWVVVLLLREKVKSKLSHIFGLLSGTSYLLIPATLYWHSIVYFTDIAVILPFSLVILLETKIRVDKNCPKYYLIFQSICLFIMTIMEYFAIPTAISIFFFRSLVKPDSFKEKGLKVIIRNCLQIFLPVAIGLLLFLVQLAKHSKINILVERFTLRTGLNSSGQEIFNNGGILKIFSHLDWIYGLLILFSILYIYKRFLKVRAPEFLIPVSGFSACILQIILLLNHSIIHSFSVLKLYYPFSITFFGIIPGIFFFEKNHTRNFVPNSFLYKQLCLYSLILIISLPSMFNWYKNPELTFTSTAKAIRDRFTYEDILFGFDGFNIKSNPPHYLALSQKLVKEIKSKRDLDSKIESLPPSGNLYFLYNKTKLRESKVC